MVSILVLAGVLIGISLLAQPAGAETVAAVAAQPAGPSAPAGPAEPAGPGAVTVTVGSPDKPSESLVILIALTVLSVAPALLLLCTSFTKIFVVLSITRNALGLT
ncbi:MAG TPA: EscR/YscR/HrcR family type III secretion system export apparatus protein, partial [Micromonosporaceae bacterium]|nr:EscR/YscR/HrcR family type III secretion system export apparatus protein [Micromonosporaceae bacterium]